MANAVENIKTACLNIPTCYLQPPWTHHELHLTHMSPSPRRGIWANVNLNSRLTLRTHLEHYHTSPSNATGSMTKAGQIWQQQCGFNNNEMDWITTIRVWQRQRSDGPARFHSRREIWDRSEGGKLWFRWYVANSFHPFLPTDHPYPTHSELLPPCTVADEHRWKFLLGMEWNEEQTMQTSQPGCPSTTKTRTNPITLATNANTLNQCQCLEPNVDASNPTWTLWTQCQRLEPHVNVLNPTPTPWT